MRVWGQIDGLSLPAGPPLVVDGKVYVDLLSLLVAHFMLSDGVVVKLVRHDGLAEATGLLLVVCHEEHSLSFLHEPLVAIADLLL